MNEVELDRERGGDGMETDEFVKRDPREARNVWQTFLSVAIASCGCCRVHRRCFERCTLVWCTLCRKGNIAATVIYNRAIYRGQLPEEHNKTKHPLCTYAGHGVVCGVYINFTGVILAASYRVHAFIISLGSHLLGKVY